MELVSVIVALALVEYFVFGLLVGRARTQFGVAAPATAGHPVFDRTMRVQQNTLEQLAIFIPAMYLFGAYVSPRLAALLGIIFIAGRAVYYRGYVQEAAKRETGFVMSIAPQILLLLGGLVGAVVAWLG